MIKEIEELIKIVGKGNLLETLFIFLGSFRKKEEPLDKYFNLKFSLQGLFLIYAQAYQILSENNNLNTKDVIDKIYEVIKGSELNEYINEVVDGRK